MITDRPRFFMLLLLLLQPVLPHGGLHHVGHENGGGDGPTPPGTGVMAFTMGSTSSKAASPRMTPSLPTFTPTSHHHLAGAGHSRP